MWRVQGEDMINLGNLFTSFDALYVSAKTTKKKCKKKCRTFWTWTHNPLVINQNPLVINQNPNHCSTVLPAVRPWILGIVKCKDKINSLCKYWRNMAEPNPRFTTELNLIISNPDPNAKTGIVKMLLWVVKHTIVPSTMPLNIWYE